MRQDRVKYLAIASVLGLLAVQAYVSLHGSRNPSATEMAGTEDGEQQSLAGSYLAARHASLYADDEKASYFLSKALDRDPKDTELKDQAIESYLLSGNLPQAVSVIRKDGTLKTPLANLVLLVEDAQQGDWGKASGDLDKLHNYGLQAVTLPFLKSWVQLAKKNEVVPPQASLNLKHSFYQSFVNYQNALLYDQAGDADQAAVYYDLSLNDLQVIPQRFVLVAMQFYLRQNNVERAQEIYRNYQRANADVLSIQVQPVEAVMKELEAYGRKPMIPTPKEGIAEVMTTMATLLHGELLEREALQYIRLALVLEPDEPSALMLLASVLEETGKHDQALSAYRMLPENSTVYRRGLLRQAFLLDHMDKFADAASLLKAAAQKEPKPADLYMTLADLERDHQHFDDAIAHYTQALAVLGEAKPYHWPLYYTRGISYERAGQWEKAEADFDKALKLKPDEPEVLNYLAYSWILQNRNVDKAVAMLEQAAAARPDEGHIIDSLAWAYHTTKKDDLALEYIEQAIELMPGDPTVNDHYGDILWAVGRHGEARFQWERAEFFKPEPDDLARIRQKLQTGLPSSPAPSAAVSPLPVTAVAH